jgi:hypothetical protein
MSTTVTQQDQISAFQQAVNEVSIALWRSQPIIAALDRDQSG